MKEWIIFRLWYYRKILIIAAIISLIIIIADIFLTRVTETYYYIDFNGEVGVATECWEGGNGLICNRLYGGKQVVQQYWQVK